MIHTGDCLEVMRTLPEASVDAVVTDPPYGLEFMGKAWDAFNGGQQGRWKGRKQKAGRFDTDGLGAADLGKRLSARPSHGSDSRGKKCLNCGHYKFSGTPCKCLEPRWEIRTGTPPNMAAYQAWCEAWGREALRVTVPGGYLLAFGGTRTHHRLVCGLEDAGWIIRDELDWIYASGFPKGKANLKPAHEPIVLARKPGPLRMLNIDGCRIGTEEVVSRGGIAPGAHNLVGGPNLDREPTTASGRWPANVILTDPVFDGGVDGVVGGGASEGFSGGGVRNGGDGDWGSLHGDGKHSPYHGDSGTYSRFFELPKGDNGTCARCGLAISADRPSYQPSPSAASAPTDARISPAGTPEPSTDPATPGPSRGPTSTTDVTEPRFWHDDGATTPPTPKSKQRGTSPASAPPSSPAKSPAAGSPETATTTTTASRYLCVTCAVAITSPSTSEPPDRDYPWAFIVPKADRADREPLLRGQLAEGEAAAYDHRPSGDINKRLNRVRQPVQRENGHPTVKPIELMRHLVRLVTPPGGTVLDPFLGSGTTAIAAEMEGFAWIGVEKEAEYVAIAEARLNGVQRGLGLDVPAPTKKRAKSKDQGAGTRCSFFPEPCQGHPGHGRYSPTVHARPEAGLPA